MFSPVSQCLALSRCSINMINEWRVPCRWVVPRHHSVSLVQWVLAIIITNRCHPHYPPFPTFSCPPAECYIFSRYYLAWCVFTPPPVAQSSLPGIHWHNQPGACPEPAKLVLMLAHEEGYSFPAQLLVFWAPAGHPTPLPTPPHTCT